MMIVWMAACDLGMPVDPNSPVSYQRQVQPVFNRSCNGGGCHNSADAAGGLVLESWESLLRGSEHGAMIIPFRPDRSHLIFHINTDSTVAPASSPLMPPGSPLSREEVSLLMRWVSDGARNDRGEVPFANPAAGKVYVTNQGEDEIAVIDIATNLLIRMVQVGTLNNRTSPPEAPHNVVADQQGQYYYVNLIVQNELWKYRVRDDAFMGRALLGANASPAQVALTSGGTRGYISNFDLSGTKRSIQVFNPQTMQLFTGEITDPRLVACHGVKLTNSGLFLWSANQQSDNLAIIQVSNDSILSFLKVDPSVPDLQTSQPAFGPYQIVFSANDQYAYVTCRVSNEVRVFNTQPRQLAAIIPVGPNPLILDITPDGQHVYVANRGSGASPSRSVSVIRTSDNTEVTRIQDVGVEPHGVAVTKDGKYVYVSCENVNSPDAPHHPTAGLKTPGIVAVIDVATNQVIRRIEVGAFAAGIAVVP